MIHFGKLLLYIRFKIKNQSASHFSKISIDLATVCRILLIDTQQSIITKSSSETYAGLLSFSADFVPDP